MGKKEIIKTITAEDNRLYVFMKRRRSGRLLFFRDPTGRVAVRLSWKKFNYIEYDVIEKNNFVGMIVLNLNTMMISDLFIRRDYRNIGVGTALISIAGGDLIKQGYTNAYTYAEEEDKAKFYRELGVNLGQKQWYEEIKAYAWKIEFTRELFLSKKPKEIAIRAKK